MTVHFLCVHAGCEKQQCKRSPVEQNQHFRSPRTGMRTATWLARDYRNRELDAGFVIQSGRRGQVELVDRNIAVALVED